MSELDVTNLISVAQAIEIIDSAEISPRIVDVTLDHAHTHCLAEDIVADRDYPPFDKSLMDGFAIAFKQGTDDYDIVGEIAAGAWPDRAIKPGEAVAIMTGAPLPAGADRVVPIEKVNVSGKKARLLEPSKPAQCIAAQGADVRAGQTVLRKGQQLEAAQLAVAATVGRTSLSVFDKPLVGILSTGDEVIPPNLVPKPGQIRNCNDILLMSLLRRLDCRSLHTGHCPDNPEKIANSLDFMLRTMEILFITGGMSMGQYDYAPQVLQQLGVKLLITKVRIKPGKPFLFGVKHNCFIFGLPGNPVSAMVCTVRLASRLVRRFCGRSPEPRWIESTLLADLPANGPREFYQPVRLDRAGAMSLHWKGSADVFTLAQADALLPRPQNAPPLSAGQRIQVMAIDRF